MNVLSKEQTNDFAQLAGFVATLEPGTLSRSTMASARACLLYGLAVGIATLRSPTARPACALNDLDGARSDGPATRLLDGRRVSAGDASFANAVLLSGRVQGDSHPAGHIGGVVIPAALAMAELQQLSGADLIASLVAGYEVALRIGRDHATDLSRRGFRTTPCYGVFGAAAAAGRACGMDGNQIETALGLAANLAGGLRECVDAATEEAPFQAGFAARNGIGAALIAATGIAPTADSALGGDAGFYRSFGGESVSDPALRLNHAVGEHFEFATVTFKPYPVCQFFRGVVAGMAVLRGRAGDAALQSAHVAMNPFEAEFVGVAHQGPFASPEQTVMSAPFCAALGWMTGTATYAHVRNVADPHLNALARRISVVADPALDRYRPRLAVLLEDGRTLEWQDETSEDAYTLTWDAAVRATPELFAEMDIGTAASDRLIEVCAGVEILPDVTPLMSAVRAAIKSSRTAGQL